MLKRSNIQQQLGEKRNPPINVQLLSTTIAHVFFRQRYPCLKIEKSTLWVSTVFVSCVIMISIRDRLTQRQSAVFWKCTLTVYPASLHPCPIDTKLKGFFFSQVLTTFFIRFFFFFLNYYIQKLRSRLCTSSLIQMNILVKIPVRRFSDRGLQY